VRRPVRKWRIEARSIFLSHDTLPASRRVLVAGVPTTPGDPACPDRQFGEAETPSLDARAGRAEIGNGGQPASDSIRGLVMALAQYYGPPFLPRRLTIEKLRSIGMDADRQHCRTINSILEIRFSPRQYQSVKRQLYRQYQIAHCPPIGSEAFNRHRSCARTGFGTTRPRGPTTTPGRRKLPRRKNHYEHGRLACSPASITSALGTSCTANRSR
jgi:hypothetical protein